MPYKEPWNKGRVVGQSPPLTPDQVDLIRLLLGVPTHFAHFDGIGGQEENKAYGKPVLTVSDTFAIPT